MRALRPLAGMIIVVVGLLGACRPRDWYGGACRSSCTGLRDVYTVAGGGNRSLCASTDCPSDYQCAILVFSPIDGSPHPYAGSCFLPCRTDEDCPWGRDRWGNRYVVCVPAHHSEVSATGYCDFQPAVYTPEDAGTEAGKSDR